MLHQYYIHSIECLGLTFRPGGRGWEACWGKQVFFVGRCLGREPATGLFSDQHLKNKGGSPNSRPPPKHLLCPIVSALGISPHW